MLGSLIFHKGHCGTDRKATHPQLSRVFVVDLRKLNLDGLQFGQFVVNRFNQRVEVFIDLFHFILPDHCESLYFCEPAQLCGKLRDVFQLFFIILLESVALVNNLMNLKSNVSDVLNFFSFFLELIGFLLSFPQLINFDIFAKHISLDFQGELFNVRLNLLQLFSCLLESFGLDNTMVRVVCLHRIDKYNERIE